MPFPSLDSSMLMIIISFLYLCFCVGGRGLSTHTTPRPFHPCREKISGSWHIFVFSYLCFWKGRGKRMEKSIFQKKKKKIEKRSRDIYFFFFLYSAFTFFLGRRKKRKGTHLLFFSFAGTILGNFYNRKNVSFSFVPAKHTFFFF